MTERPDSELPDHERRPETDLGAGITGEGGTTPEMGTDKPTIELGPGEDARQPTSDIEDPEPEDPNGPEVAYTPRSI